MVARIFIDNFKGFVNFEMQCGPMVFLMGSNGSGKSTLIDVLHALAMVIEDARIDDHFDATTRFRFSTIPQQRFELDLQIAGRLYHYRLTIGFEGREEKPIVVREQVTAEESQLFLFEHGVLHLFDDLGREKANLPFDAHKGGLAIVEDRGDNQHLTAFKAGASQFLLLRLNPTTVEPQARKADRFLLTDASNFVAWYETVANADTLTWLEYLRTMQAVIPGLSAINLVPMGGRGKLLEARFSAQSGTSDFYLDELSQGQISLLVHYAILYFAVREGMTVAFDEPDNYLALAEIEPFLYALEDAAEHNHAQVFVISHHPEIYNRWARDPNRCRYMERQQDGRFTARPVDWDAYPGITPAEVVARGWQDG